MLGIKKTIFVMLLLSGLFCLGLLQIKSALAITTEHVINKAQIPILSRVRPQVEIVSTRSVIDKQWVAVGIKQDYAIQKDYQRLFNGAASYRFELKQADNRLTGYKKGTSKGRAELATTYATDQHLDSLTPIQIKQLQAAKAIYHYGDNIAAQGSTYRYQFSLYLPHDLPENVSTIFAQWHGMPSRTLIRTPQGEVQQLTYEQFAKLSETMLIKKNKGYHKVVKRNARGETQFDQDGKAIYKRGKENGYLVEQGGYPPLAFGFSKGSFYIKANSDAQWLSDKTDRTNASVSKHKVMQTISSPYKESVIPFKMPLKQLPKETWLNFTVKVKWSAYDPNSERVIKAGLLDVTLSYQDKLNAEQQYHLVKTQKLNLGRNDQHGYYFKFGIYRVANSTVPVSYNLAGFQQQKLSP